jgi:hypothetical protein
MSKAKTKKPAFAPPPKVRDYLYHWPAGETRTATGHSWMNGVHTPANEFYEIMYAWTERAVAAGYLTLHPLAGTPSVHTMWTSTRTDKPIKPYTPVPVEKKRARYKGIFPWSADDHWSLIEQSPVRLPEVIAHELTKKDPAKRFRAHNRSVRDKMTAPLFLNTKAQLVTLRDVLPAVLGSATVGRRTRDAMNLWGWLPRDFLPLLVTGVGLRMLCLELLVEPEFDDAGKFVRFVALDAQEAADELGALSGSGKSLTEKYREFMEARREAADVP